MDDAVASYHAALDVDPEYVEARRNLGQALLFMGWHCEGLEQLRKFTGVIEFDQDTTDGYTLIS